MTAVDAGAATRSASEGQPMVRAVPGPPVLLTSQFDLESLGYRVEEFFLEGVATSYQHRGEAGADGRWDAEQAATAPYRTRVVVIRPSDPERFNGAVAVEWLNVSGGLDAAPDWSFTHRELIRGGFAFVGVSAQRVGLEGGDSLMPANPPLKKVDPARYGGLNHPGDAFAFDIYSQAGRAVRSGELLGPLAPRRLLAMGESQSAIFLTTYINAVDPLAQVYDGFLVHSRFGAAPSLEGASILGAATRTPEAIRLRADRRVPVITVIAETDLLGSGGLRAGFLGARQPDDDRLRVWEIAGTAHADNYIFLVAAIDSGEAPIADLAAAWAPTASLMGMVCAKPINAAPQHRYVVSAALRSLDAWVAGGPAPAQAEPLEVGPGEAADSPSLVLDGNGNARGGVRSPWVDAPTARLSGFGNSGGPLAFLVGSTEPFDAATLASLYPGGRADYLARFEKALDRTIDAGFILTADRPEILALADAMWPGRP